MEKTIAVLAGDGIGPEVTQECCKILNAVAEKYGHQFTYTKGRIGAEAIDLTGSPLPAETIEVCEAANAILLGAVGDPKYDDPSLKIRPEQGLLAIRKILALYANIRPVKSNKAIAHLCPIKLKEGETLDYVIVRELTSGIYFGNKEQLEDGNAASDTCYYNIDEIDRITKIGLNLAEKRNKKLCLIDKANVLETSRLWRKVVNQYEKERTDINFSYLYIDNATMQVILNPYQFDVIITSNMFGDIISDESSVLAGSLGMLPSGSYGEDKALFEPVHGSYPQAAGKNIANPIASILSGAMMLRYFGLEKEADHIESAIDLVLEHGLGTEDLQMEHKIGTSQFGDILSSIILDDLTSLNVEKILQQVGTII